jgi:hypothetical protein
MEVAMTEQSNAAQPAELFHCDRCDDTGEVEGGPCSCVAGMLVHHFGQAKAEKERAERHVESMLAELFGHQHEHTDNRCLYEDDDGITRCCYIKPHAHEET